ncbi:unnamed protein product [Closterium sp. NIES-65]|nr:unnamed protein product [Closterium sp. NIES-65]
MGALIDTVKEAVVGAVRAELAANKEERDELQHMLTAVEERNYATASLVEELAAVREELAGYKEEVKELRLKLTAVEEKNEMTAAVMEEREGELAAVKRELAEHKDALKKLDDDLQISHSGGDEKTAWEAIKSASQATHLDLQGCKGR